MQHITNSFDTFAWLGRRGNVPHHSDFIRGSPPGLGIRTLSRIKYDSEWLSYLAQYRWMIFTIIRDIRDIPRYESCDAIRWPLANQKARVKDTPLLKNVTIQNFVFCKRMHRTPAISNAHYALMRLSARPNLNSSYYYLSHNRDIWRELTTTWNYTLFSHLFGISGIFPNIPE
jgi:hypothetical protein